MSITSTGTSFPLASLYVGDLHPEVTEAMLFEKFSSAGAVLSIRVCRDMITRRSLGYAYVNFQDPSVAERAIETMNYDSIKGRPIRIMWSQRDPSLRRSGQGNIFIKNLDKSIDNKSMYDTFSGFGPILSCKVAQDENGNSKGYAFVHFESDQAATAAIEKINGMMLNGKKVFVGRFIPRSERDQNREGQPRKFTNVFVKNFEEELDDDKLHELFKEFGNITSHRVMTDPQTGKSRGFGFVSFDNPESAEKAVEKMNGHQLGNGKTLYVGRAQKRAERQQELRRMFEAKRQERQSRFVGANLYVKNLDESVDDEQLKAAFAQFGNINSAKIMREGGRSKGFGFVCFSSPEEATKAVSAMNGHVLAGKPLYVAMAQRKEDRRVQMAASMMRRFQPTPQQQFGGPNAAAAAAQFQQQLYQQLPPGMQYMFPAGAMPQRGFFPAAQMGGGQFGGMMARQPRPYAAMGGPRTQYGMNSTGYARMPRAPRMNNMGPRGVPQQAGGAMGLPTQQQQQPQPGGPVNVPGGVPPQSRLAGPSVMGGVRQQQQNGMMPPNQQGGPIGAPGQPGLRTGAQSFVRPAPTAAQMTARPAATTTSASGIDPSVLAQAAPADQKQMLGEKLFPIIQKSYPELAGKVTGMLLEIDNAELLLLLDSPDQLKNKVEEAVSVLKKHIGKAPVTAPGGGAPEGGDGHKVEPAK